MGPDDTLYNREAQAATPELGAEKRIEGFRPRLLWYANAGIGNLQPHVAAGNRL
jgi:hypothetical protein